MLLSSTGFRQLEITNRMNSFTPVLFIRGAKQKATKQKSMKERQKKDHMMRDMLKKVEIKKQLSQAIVKIAMKGERLDPEMLNPARKRLPIEETEEEKEKRILLLKDWTRYKMEQHKQDLQQLQGMMESRNKALRELKKVSGFLYEEALKTRADLFPFIRTGPPQTPPIPDYTPPELVD